MAIKNGKFFVFLIYYFSTICFPFCIKIICLLIVQLPNLIYDKFLKKSQLKIVIFLKKSVIKDYILRIRINNYKSQNLFIFINDLSNKSNNCSIRIGRKLIKNCFKVFIYLLYKIKTLYHDVRQHTSAFITKYSVLIKKNKEYFYH